MTDINTEDKPTRGSLKSAELEILSTITSGIASFGLAVRGSALSNEEKSRVLARLAEASGSLMDATTTYLAGVRSGRPADVQVSALAH